MRNEANPAPAPARPEAREVEVKFAADAAAIAAVLRSPLLENVRVAPARELVSTYFDTAERDLERAFMTLRLRRKARAIPVLGVKWDRGGPDEIFGRGEIEVRCPDGQPQVALFAGPVRQRLAEAIGDRPLAPVFETRISRRVALFGHGRSEIELSIDEGFVLAGEAKMPVSEIELELKAGSPEDLIACAAILARDCGLSLAFEAKAARGYRLRDASPPKPQKAKPVALGGQASFDDMVAAVIATTLGHFVSNWAALRKSDDPEAIHQLRVALRRLRSALGVFRRVLSMPEIEDIRAGAKRIASALGPARDCDAFRQNALEGPLHDGPEGAAALLEAVEARRRDCYAAARQVIDDPATSLFVLDVQSLLGRRAWRSALHADGLGLLTSPAQPFAGSVLGRLTKRALKRGKHLSDLPAEARHELRIALKNLRYAAEFFGSLFPGQKDVKGFIRRVADLQEDLGAQNDAATAQAFVAALALPPGSPAAFAAGFLLGWYRHATQAAEARLSRKWKDFRQAAPFWE